MSAEQEESCATAVRSPVGWALLGLVIEQPGYGRELFRRFEQAYENVLPLGSPAQIYEALDTLVRRSLVRELESTGDSSAEDTAQRRPSRLRYGATPKGVRAHRDWLVAQAREERRRARFVTIQIAALPPQKAIEVVDGYRITLLESAHEMAVGPLPDSDRDERAEEQAALEALAARLVGQEQRLAVQAKLNWIEFARAQLESAVEAQGGPRRTQPPE